MTIRSWLVACAAAWVMTVAVSAQDAAAVLRSHGGAALERLDEYEARGVADTPEGALDFTLKVSGDRSRLELGGRVFIRQGAVGQWRSDTGRWSDPSRVREEQRDVYLLPVFAVRNLGFYNRRPDTPAPVFERVVPRRSHIAYQAPRPTVELLADGDTGLLSEALFEDESGGASPALFRYSDYRRVQGVALPGLVSRQIGDAAVWTFRFDSFDLRPAFSAADFEFTR